MGVDLKLLPLTEYGAGRFAFSHTLLEVERRSDLFRLLEAFPDKQPAPEAFNSFIGKKPSSEGDYGYGETSKDAYGSPLKTMTAKQFYRFTKKDGVQDNHVNRAVWAYLAALPPETKIVLYWH